MQRNFNQQIPESMGTQDTNKGKGGSPCLKSRKYGNIFPFLLVPCERGKGMVTTNY